MTIPNQAVDDRGNISVPYAGIIRAKGRTQVEVQQAIVDAIKNRAIEPQVVVSLVDQRTSLISVLGEVNRPFRFPANMEAERVLDAITRAGGPKSQGFDTFVSLERGGRRVTVPFGALVYQPPNNIYVHAGDTIYVYIEPQTFLAFGAVTAGAVGVVAVAVAAAVLPDRNSSLTHGELRLPRPWPRPEALAMCLPNQHLYFFIEGSPAKLLSALVSTAQSLRDRSFRSSTIVNLRDPAGFFLARAFEIRNKDVLYVSNATSVQITKFLTYLRAIMATANDPIAYATNYYALKGLINGTGNVATIAGGAAAH